MSTVAVVRPIKPDLYFPTLVVFALSTGWIASLPSDEALGARMMTGLSVLATMAVMRALTAHLFTARAGLVAAAMVGFSAPVLHVGATSVTAMTLLAGALVAYLAITRDALWTAVPIGLLSGAMTIGPTPTVPMVLPLLVLGALPPTTRRTLRTTAAVAIASAVMLSRDTWASVAPARWVRDETFAEAIGMPVVPGDLSALSTQLLWPVVVAACFGLWFVLRRRDWSTLPVALGLVAVALIPPLTSVTISEIALFHDYLAYTALFLAPLAGWGLARPWKTVLWTPALTFLLAVTFTWGAVRAHDLFII